MNLELLPQAEAVEFSRLKSLVMEHAEKVGLTFDALKRIRDGKLYRAEFKTFEAFCQSVGLGTRRAYRMIEEGYGQKVQRRIVAKKEPAKEAAAEGLSSTDLSGILPGLCSVIIPADIGMTMPPAIKPQQSASDKVAAKKEEPVTGPLFNEVWPGEERLEKLWQETDGIDLDGQAWLTPRCARIAAMDDAAGRTIRTAVRVNDGQPARLEKKPDAATETPFRQGDYVELASGSAASVEKKLSAMMEKPVIDIRTEQYRTHSPIPAMDRPEEKAITYDDLQAFKDTVIADMDNQSAVRALKAWEEKRRAMNDATSEEDAVWACYIAQQILL